MFECVANELNDARYVGMNEISRNPAHTVVELASARQHQKPADHH